jgi:hypothetical protein
MRTRDWLVVATALTAWSPLAHAQDEGQMPPGHAPGAMPGVFTPPEDTEQEDPLLPPGTIAVDLRDADDKPVAGEAITLGILVNSIAKGDSRSHVQHTTDASGHVVFGSLDTTSTIAYRVSVGYQGGAFAATPFQLGQVKAMHVVLHVYPVTHDVQQTIIVTEATLAGEVRDDRIQMEEVFTVYNLGRKAWQPLDVEMKLPPGETAFAAQASMSDQGVDEAGGLARLRGTFPPGRHTIEFRWQLPWSDNKDVDFQVGLPPHVAIARIMLPATSDIKLSVGGFPPASVRHDTQGQSFLVTERQLRPEDAKLTSLSVGIHDLPTPGPGRMIALGLAACGVAAGLLFASGRRQRARTGPEATSVRTAVLEELAELERGRVSGEIGPKTYERARRELIDTLARTLAET